MSLAIAAASDIRAVGGRCQDREPRLRPAAGRPRPDWHTRNNDVWPVWCRVARRMNGHVAFWFSLLAFYALAHQWRFVAIGELGAGAGGGGGGGGGKEGQPLLPISSLYDMHGALVLCTIAVSTALSVYLYVSSFAPLGRGLGAEESSDTRLRLCFH